MGVAGAAASGAITGGAASGAAASGAVTTAASATGTTLGASVVAEGAAEPSSATPCPGTMFPAENASPRDAAFMASDALASTPFAHDKAGSAASANHHLRGPDGFGQRLDDSIDICCYSLLRSA